MKPGTIKARYAVLVEKFHLTLPEIAELTERQIEEVYFHPRDDEGRIVFPDYEAPSSLPDTAPKRDKLIAKVNAAYTAKEISKARWEELRRKIDAAHPPPEGS